MKIIVTGGAGFIGSQLVKKLNREKITDITIVDALGKSTKWKNLLGLKFNKYLHKDQFLELVKGKNLACDAVVHLGACSSTLEMDVDYLMQNNFEYTKTLAKICIDKQIRFIYASSGATYGLGLNGYEDDHDKLQDLKPLNPYGFSKYLFDLYAKQESILDKICGLKFFNVYGPNEYHKGTMSSVVWKAYNQIKETGKVKLFKSNSQQYRDGDQVRDFISVEDCNKVIYWLLNNKTVNGVFNVSTGKAESWNSLVKAVFKSLKLDPNIEYIDMPSELKKQYQNFTEGPIKKLRSSGYNERFLTLEEGVEQYIRELEI